MVWSIHLGGSIVKCCRVNPTQFLAGIGLQDPTKICWNQIQIFGCDVLISPKMRFYESIHVLDIALSYKSTNERMR